ncbi:MAG: translation initiation factor IF-2, partial [Kiritimatiellaeota bacterium]|nr:translation initiation factor IF-2 [Kiritimatiellota bacterium]
VSSAFNKPPAPPPPRPGTPPPQAGRPGQPPPRPGEKPRRPDEKPRRDDRPQGRPGGRDERPQSRPGTPPPQAGRPGQPAPARPGAPGAPAAPTGRVIALRGAVVIKDLAELMSMRPNRLIADLMQLNVLANINQRIELDQATRIAEKYGFKVELERQKRAAERRPVLPNATKDDEIPDDPPESLVPRPPIVTFLGHVDHGKTSLMDRIRDAKVAAGEAGGITQHIGAYTVDVNGKKITFLDTPGHAAFSSMRARGANMTDIAVVIIAADDGVMPQTREAIRHAKNANVQIMVAINKCDLPQAKPERVKQMLQGEGLTPEEWGGDIVCCEVSAHTGAGVDHLLEMILLQADMLELTANPSRRADGFVVEAQLEQGRGPTAPLLVDGGTLKVGDVVLIGEHFGKIRGLVDERGRMVKSAGPSTAVRCMGLSGVPEAGAHFRVMLNDKRARELAEQFARDRRATELAASQKATVENLFTKIKEQQQLNLAVIVKADTQGSVEAICQSLREIRSNKVSLTLVADAVGNVSQADIQRAAAAGAHIIGFHVGCEPGVQSQARHDGVRVNTFRIIYELLEHVRSEMLKLLPAEFKEIVRGHAEIRMIFNIGKKGRVAGCQMLDGTLRAKERVRVKRKSEVLYDGKFLTLQHFQDEVDEITSAQECGIRFTGNFEAFEVGDVVECYAKEELERTL